MKERQLNMTNRCSHITPFFWLTSVHLDSCPMVYSVQIVLFQSLHNLLPERFSKIFVRNITSRLSFDLRPHYCTRQASEFSIKYSGPQIWNALPNKIKMSKTINSFKFQMKKLFFKWCGYGCIPMLFYIYVSYQLYHKY